MLKGEEYNGSSCNMYVCVSEYEYRERIRVVTYFTLSGISL